MTRKLSDARTDAALHALRNGCTREAAAGVAGVGRATLYRWLAADETFRDAVEKAENEAEASFTAAVVAATQKNWQAAAWWLERRRHESYGRRDRLEMTVDVKALAAKIATEDGLNADDLMAEAERILGMA